MAPRFKVKPDGSASYTDESGREQAVAPWVVDMVRKADPQQYEHYSKGAAADEEFNQSWQKLKTGPNVDKYAAISDYNKLATPETQAFVDRQLALDPISRLDKFERTPAPMNAGITFARREPIVPIGREDTMLPYSPPQSGAEVALRGGGPARYPDVNSRGQMFIPQGENIVSPYFDPGLGPTSAHEEMHAQAGRPYEAPYQGLERPVAPMPWEPVDESFNQRMRDYQDDQRAREYESLTPFEKQVWAAHKSNFYAADPHQRTGAYGLDNEPMGSLGGRQAFETSRAALGLPPREMHPDDAEHMNNLSAFRASLMEKLK